MIVLLVASSLLVFLGIRQFKINQKRITDGVTVKAKVIRIVEYPRQRGGPYFRPVVEFVTLKGETITAEPENSPAKSQFTVGEEFDVVYHPDNPCSVTTTDWTPNHVGPIVFVAAGVVLLVVAIYR
ncbi:MAG: hypothetical protein VR65_09290 [Desulfobulbaceae bacterium BRH_c16a]|nr:MAG: hypothetical protein VR65_09290 [Desulfobulbaceae bacterium BRH_c16a]